MSGAVSRGPSRWTGVHLDDLPDQREACNACMMSCYRHASAMMHGAIAVTDSAQAVARGEFRSALSSLFQRGVGDIHSGHSRRTSGRGAQRCQPGSCAAGSRLRRGMRRSSSH